MLTQTVDVPVDPERASTAFTAYLNGEGAVGAHLHDSHGRWCGTVSDWDPAKSVSFTWHPGRDPQRAGHVTVTFTPTTGGTRLALTSTGETGDTGDDWQDMLDLYAEHVQRG
ncbi:SRPBCC domain-containing protein [Kribbella sp. NPDC056345]|uniref:SRPBCC family protein n=1 Tax=Kribbella sp. NPDC056345 TaxID=3345789 RepID=UPI0035DB7FBC